MKKLLAAGLVIAGLIAFAGTCTIQHISLTKIGSNDTFAGEVHNDSGVNLLQHNVVVAFLDSSGTVLETKTVSPCLRTLQDGDVDYFSAKSSKPASQTTVGLARIAFDGTLKVGTAESGDLTLSNIVITRKDDTELTVTGTIKNNDDTKLTDVTACIVVFTSSDNVIIIGKDESISDLSHNNTDTFKVELTVPDSTSTVDRVDVHVDGLKDDVPILPESDTNNTVKVCTPTNTPVNTTTATATPTSITPTNTPTSTTTPPAATSTATTDPCD